MGESNAIERRHTRNVLYAPAIGWHRRTRKPLPRLVCVCFLCRFCFGSSFPLLFGSVSWSCQADVTECWWREKKTGKSVRPVCVCARACQSYVKMVEKCSYTHFEPFILHFFVVVVVLFFKIPIRFVAHELWYCFHWWLFSAVASAISSLFRSKMYVLRLLFWFPHNNAINAMDSCMSCYSTRWSFHFFSAVGSSAREISWRTNAKLALIRPYFEFEQKSRYILPLMVSIFICCLLRIAVFVSFQMLRVIFWTIWLHNNNNSTPNVTIIDKERDRPMPKPYVQADR